MTDPVVDSIFLVISYLILPSILWLVNGFFTATYWVLSAVVSGDALETSARFIHTVVSPPLLSLAYYTECVLERVYYDFPLGYGKQLHRLAYFKARGRATFQLDHVHYCSSPGVKTPHHCEGKTLLESFRKAGQIEFISSRDWLDTNGPR